jgi:peptidoglycan/LPS O-acetylase OafA/YrhL
MARPAIWPGVAFDPTHNSLNLFRLVFATLVIVAHCYYTGGYGLGPEPAGENLGGWAVIGFFIISGYLITGSRLASRFGAYLVRRIARIYPGFLVNLVVTAAVFAPLAFALHPGDNPAPRTLSGFLHAPTTPLGYLVANLTLRMNAYDVAGTPAGVPYPGAWDGSLWTLYYEFLCYLIVGVLFAFAAARRHARAAVTVLFGLAVAAQWQAGRVDALTGGSADAVFLAKLLPCFLAGALLYVWRDKLRYHLPGVAVALLGAAALIVCLPGWGIQLASPLLGYALMWAATVVPAPALIRREDISYGVYIYGFIVQQCLALAGLHAAGRLVYTGVSIVLTVPLAIASWKLVEQPAMRRARGQAAYRRRPAGEEAQR